MNKTKKKIDKLRLMAMLVLIAGIAYFYINLLFPYVLPFFLKLGVIDRPLNILVLGNDVSYNIDTNARTVDKGRADSIILLRFDPLQNKMNIVSIPRDSYVEIPGHGYTKINASFVYGGLDLTKKTVEHLIGIKIDKFVIINTKGIVKLVDLLGGITVDVEKDLYYVDRAGGLYINLKKGKQKLTGKQAEGFVRFRHDALGDITRMERQQKFLKALTEQIEKPTSLIKAPFIIDVVINNIKTDLSLKEFLMLANSFRMMSVKRIENTTLPGESTNNEAGSVILLNRQEMDKIIKKIF